VILGTLYVRWLSCLELTVRTLATNHFNRTFQALSKTFFSGRYRAQLIRDILFSGLYKFTLLTYLLTYLLRCRLWLKLYELIIPVVSQFPKSEIKFSVGE